MSFGFEAVRDRWSAANGQVSRELLEVILFDISPVTFPAYPQTTVSVQVRSKVTSLQRDLAAWGRVDLLRRRLELEQII